MIKLLCNLIIFVLLAIVSIKIYELEKAVKKLNESIKKKK